MVIVGWSDYLGTYIRDRRTNDTKVVIFLDHAGVELLNLNAEDGRSVSQIIIVLGGPTGLADDVGDLMAKNSQTLVILL